LTSVIDKEKKVYKLDSGNPPPPPPTTTTNLSSAAKFQKCQNWIFFKMINKKIALKNIFISNTFFNCCQSKKLMGVSLIVFL